KSPKRRSEVAPHLSGRRENESTSTMRSQPSRLRARINPEPTNPAPPVTRHHRPFMVGCNPLGAGSCRVERELSLSGIVERHVTERAVSGRSCSPALVQGAWSVHADRQTRQTVRAGCGCLNRAGGPVPLDGLEACGPTLSEPGGRLGRGGKPRAPALQLVNQGEVEVPPQPFRRKASVVPVDDQRAPMTLA